MPFPLQTERLILRNFRDSDLEPFLAYRNDPEVYRYQGWRVPFEHTMGVLFLDEMKSMVPGQAGPWFQVALELKNSGSLIGDVAFALRHAAHPQASFGFTLARPYWGQGYAGEACRAVLEYLFSELKLHRVTADCDVDNHASYRLLERLGFRREAHHQESFWLGDRWGDESIYALLEREWHLRSTAVSQA
jgi:aminoglycoside 6'-N-acetyltransferase